MTTSKASAMLVQISGGVATVSGNNIIKFDWDVYYDQNVLGRLDMLKSLAKDVIDKNVLTDVRIADIVDYATDRLVELVANELVKEE